MILYVSGRKEKERLVEALLDAYSRANTKHDLEAVEITAQDTKPHQKMRKDAKTHLTMRG